MTAHSTLRKLRQLAKVEGFDTAIEMLEVSATDSVVPGICCNPDNPSCNFSTEVEPDSEEGWCEECGENTVRSCMILAGII